MLCASKKFVKVCLKLMYQDIYETTPLLEGAFKLLENSQLAMPGLDEPKPGIAFYLVLNP